MERLLKTGVFRVLGLTANFVERLTIPLRLKDLKVAQIRAMTWLVPMILQTNGNQLAMAVFSRPLTSDAQAQESTFTPTIEKWAGHVSVMATYYSRAVLGAAPTSFQSVPRPIVFPEPFEVVTGDLTLALISSADMDIGCGVEIYYTQKTVSKEEWLKMVKEY